MYTNYQHQSMYSSAMNPDSFKKKWELELLANLQIHWYIHSDSGAYLPISDENLFWKTASFDWAFDDAWVHPVSCRLLENIQDTVLSVYSIAIRTKGPTGARLLAYNIQIQPLRWDCLYHQSNLWDRDGVLEQASWLQRHCLLPSATSLQACQSVVYYCSLYRC